MRAAFTVALIFLPAKPPEVFYEKKIFTCNFDRNGGMLPWGFPHAQRLPNPSPAA